MTEIIFNIAHGYIIFLHNKYSKILHSLTQEITCMYEKLTQTKQEMGQQLAAINKSQSLNNSLFKLTLGGQGSQNK